MREVLSIFERSINLLGIESVCIVTEIPKDVNQPLNMVNCYGNGLTWIYDFYHYEHDRSYPGKNIGIMMMFRRIKKS